MIGDDAEQHQDSTPEPYRWRVVLSDGAPQRRYAIVAVAIAAFLIGTIIFKNIVLGAIGFAIIFGSTAEFWLGSLFNVDAEGASVKTGVSVSRIEWANVKRILRDEGGIKLSPLEKSGSLDAFRGVYLRYGKDNRESVERAVLTFGKLLDTDVGHGPDRRGDGGPDPEGGG